jgi:hypothetical protein
MLWTRSSAGAVALLPVGLVIAWWGWKSGGFFEVTYLPGTIVLLGLLGALLLFAPWPGSIRSPVGLTVAALILLAAWTLISATWSSAPDVAVSDTQRTLAYAVAFALGAWACLLLGKRVLLSLAPLAIGGTAVALATLIALWVGSNSQDFFEVDGTLRYPIGYRNAEAAFFLMATLAMLVLAATREQDWRLRGALVGGATLSIELMVLAQSRASIFAAAVGVAVLIAVHPARLRVLAWLLIAAVPAVIAVPWLLDVYQHDAGNTAGSIPPLHAACRVMAITTTLGIVGACAAARLDPTIRLGDGTRKVIAGGLLASLGAVVLAGFVAIASTSGGVTGWVTGHLHELNSQTPNLTSTGTRYGLDFRTERGDVWRVARDNFADHPLDGLGSGGFRASYMLHRRETIEPEDPHSVEMLMASELGIPGIMLFATAAISAVVAALRSRRQGPEAAALVAGALAIGSYWFLHASVDWFWPYAGITLPMAFVMGAAGAPAIRREVSDSTSPDRVGKARIGIAVAAGLLAFTMLPFFFSARYTDSAIRTWHSNVGAAYSDLQRAADLNPLSSRPLAAEAFIASRNGDKARALSALSEAENRQPDDWLLYYMQAKVLKTSDPAAARQAVSRAQSLNPRGADVAALAKRLASTPP